MKNRGDKWTTEEINLAKELYLKDVILSKIAPKVNHTENAVTKKLKELGLTGGRRVLWTDEELDKLRDLFNQGFSYAEISEKLGKSVRACQGKAVRIGLKTKECNTWINNKRDNSWTDSEIETLKKCISDGMFMKDIVKTIGRSEKSIFAKMIQDLARYGIHQNKTYDIGFPKLLKPEFYPGFIAGVISGDGCIDIKRNHNTGFILRCTMAGNLDLLQHIKEILIKEICFNPEKKIMKIQASKQLYRLELSQTETIALYKWFKNNGVELMQRKQKIIEDYLKEYEKIPA